MAARKVIWSRSAYLQRKEILSFWVKNNNSNTYSIKLLNRTRSFTHQLALAPYLGRQTDIPNVRVYVMGAYNLYYTFTKKELRVVCFWDNRQNREILRLYFPQYNLYVKKFCQRLSKSFNISVNNNLFKIVSYSGVG